MGYPGSFHTASTEIHKRALSILHLLLTISNQPPRTTQMKTDKWGRKLPYTGKPGKGTGQHEEECGPQFSPSILVGAQRRSVLRPVVSLRFPEAEWPVLTSSMPCSPSLPRCTLLREETQVLLISVSSGPRSKNSDSIWFYLIGL